MGLVLKILGLILQNLGFDTLSLWIGIENLGINVQNLGIDAKNLGFDINNPGFKTQDPVIGGLHMDYERIKQQANDILNSRSPEGTYIEYKASSQQYDKILKTICAYGNNYYDNDFQYIFIGVEEVNDGQQKAIPKLPVSGIDQGRLEKDKNELNHLRSYLYPNVSFEVLSNTYEGRSYLLIVCPRQTGGPFMVSEKAEKDKKIHLKAGRYVRIEADTRLARVDEEYDLLRKFSNYHYSSISTTSATVDDLSGDLINEYVAKTSDREIMAAMSKDRLIAALRLCDKNDPTGRRVRNFAVLMFAEQPDKFIPYAYTELIVDMFGSKRRMESKYFKGPIWRQYLAAVSYISDNFLNTITLRNPGEAENEKISNFPFTAVEELIANAIVHNNYENGKPIQIYISEKQINIVNYNKPLPPLSLQDLNDRTIFNERDTENPEIRDMFKALGIIESFGTGIGEAKRALAANQSPDLYYKIFTESDNVTSVVIPVCETYLELKSGNITKKNPKSRVDSESQAVKKKILDSEYSESTKSRMIMLYDTIGTEIFGNQKVKSVLQCSETTATSYIKKMHLELGIISTVEGAGKGKYRFAVKS